MRANKLIFNHVLLVSERQQWRNGIARLHPMSNVALSKGFLSMFQDAAVERIRLALHPKGLRLISAVDANGHAAQKAAMKARRTILQRIHPGRMRTEESEECAAMFLLGMESPPPRNN